MKQNILKELLKQSGKPCISLILSTELKSFDEKGIPTQHIREPLIEEDYFGEGFYGE